MVLGIFKIWEKPPNKSWVGVIISSVFWISLRNTLPNPKIEKLTPIFLLFFTKKVKNENKSPQNFYLASIFIVEN